MQGWIKGLTGAEFHDFAGSVVVHAVGGWIALPAVILLGARSNRYRKDGAISAHPPSSIPFLALGAWILTVGWFGFNVMSAQTTGQDFWPGRRQLVDGHGGRNAGWRWLQGKNDPGFVHNGPHWQVLVAVCAGSDLMHPLGALVVGAAGRHGVSCVMFTLTQNRWKIDDVLGVWPLHGLCGAWGGIACGIFWQQGSGRIGRRHLGRAVDRHRHGRGLGLAGGCGGLRNHQATMGLRMTQEEEYEGADLSIHRIGSTPDREVNW